MVFNQTYVSPPYVPRIWNDTGVYTYFYIDFKKPLAAFSIGMWVDSILIMGNALLTPTSVEKINASTYKVYVPLSDLYHGLFVTSKRPTRLYTEIGKEVPAFAVHMNVDGLSYYLDAAYIYDRISYINVMNALEIQNVVLCANLNTDSTVDNATYATPYTAADTLTITLT